MIVKEPQIPLLELVTCLSDAMDLVSPVIVNHHKQVAYIAFAIGSELGLKGEDLNDIVFAAALHDVGALSLKERINALHFELEAPHHHAQQGASLLKLFKPFPKMASIVEFHHVPWRGGSGEEYNGSEVPLASHILHLADRIAVLINRQEEILGQVEGIRSKIAEQSGKMFMPKLVDAFESLAEKEFFWLDTVSSSIGALLNGKLKQETVKLDLEGLVSLSNLFRKIIDFRCSFTATHSSGVAASAETLAKLAGFSERECQMMRVAGYLHDLGKLAVPVEILQKPGKLTEAEFRVVKSHTFYTYRILESLNDFEIINSWASFHHERLDGTGYPFHLTSADLSLGSRILAAADVFTAILEDRPYRKGMESSEALSILQGMADRLALDSNIVSLLKDNFEEVNNFRNKAQKESVNEYNDFSIENN